jgi:alanine-glyoxylate transaminase/serine-glyoxylate transaminase/serine-pyruvate transaminase
LSKVAGKLFRIGHLGDMNEIHLMAAINGAEMAMLDCGVSVKPGSGAAAASTFWRSNTAPSGLGPHLSLQERQALARASAGAAAATR